MIAIGKAPELRMCCEGMQGAALSGAISLNDTAALEEQRERGLRGFM
jgi:hypothetical protein